MTLTLNEDQTLLVDTAARLADERAPVSRVRALRDDEDPVGYDPGLWREMAELGLVGIPFPERFGGMAMGLFELGLVMEQLGRNLAPEPFLSAALLGGQALLLGDAPATQDTWLPRITAGEAVVTLAHHERGARYDLDRVTTRAVPAGGAWALTGEKHQVIDGHGADGIIVPARTDAGLTLFMIRGDDAGLTRTPERRLDGRAVAHLRLEGVQVDREALVGPEGGGLPILEAAVDRATLGLAAEMLGAASQAFAMTLEYLKTRKQFGVTIGSFQALQHRAARLFLELEMTRSAVRLATHTADADPSALPRMASLAKARCGDTFLHVADEAVQLHGGIGMTDEHDIGFYMKRARAASATFGDAEFHRDRWARLGGY